MELVRIAVALVLLLGALASAESIVLTPETNIKIVERLPKEEFNGLLAKDLERYLLLALGKKELAGAGEAATFVIEAKAGMWNEVPREDLETASDIDAYVIEIAARPEKTVRIAGNTMLGAGFGVFAFLEKRLGVAWCFPGDLGVSLPTAKRFDLPEGRERVKPWFISRTYTGMKYAQPERMAAFRKSPAGRLLHGDRYFFEGYDYFKSMRLHLLTHASHNMFHIYPVKEYGEKLPDIYPMKEGRRFIPTERNGWHPCYTHPQTAAIAIEKAKAAYAAGAHCFSLGINDGRRVQCECDTCRAKPWPEPYFDYVKTVSEAVKDYYPPHLIGVLSYGDVKLPPPGLVLPDNVLVLVTGGRVGLWQDHAKSLGVYEWAFGRGFWTANFPLKALRHNFPAYREAGATVFHAEVHPVWAFDAPRVYIMSRLLWDPGADVDALLRHWCRAAFGEGGAAMERYYRRWSSLRENDSLRDGFFPPCRMDLWRRSSGQFAQCTPDDYAFMASCFDEARTKVKPGPETARLEMAETFFAYSRNLFEMNRLPHDVFAQGVPQDWKAMLASLKERLDTRQDLLDRMRQHGEWFAGTGTTPDEITGGEWEQHSAWTLNNDMNSAVKTLLFNLAQAGKAAEALALIGEAVRPYAAKPEILPMRTKPRDKHGWYTEERGYASMDVTAAAGGISFKTRPTTARIEEGQRAGDWVQHVAMVNAAFAKPVTPKVFLCEITLTGRKGSVQINTVNFMLNIGWSPVSIDHGFTDKAEAVTMRFLVEPVFPDHEQTAKATSHDVHIIWTPEADDSSLEGACAIRQVTYEGVTKVPNMQ